MQETINRNHFFLPELNYVYCTKKLKLSKMSSGIVRVWTAANGSVDMVNASIAGSPIPLCKKMLSPVPLLFSGSYLRI